MKTENKTRNFTGRDLLLSINTDASSFFSISTLFYVVFAVVCVFFYFIFFALPILPLMTWEHRATLYGREMKDTDIFRTQNFRTILRIFSFYGIISPHNVSYIISVLSNQFSSLKPIKASSCKVR